jgi:predicted DNA-binding transcriptional regulator AlpA
MTDNAVSESLKTTEWLSKKLNLSRSTIERLRKKQGNVLPPHILFGNSIRYDVNTVEKWISQRQQAQISAHQHQIIRKVQHNDI